MMSYSSFIIPNSSFMGMARYGGIMKQLVRLLGALLAGSLLFGCSRVQDDPGTGAKECVQKFFQAIIEEDWQRAYENIAPENQKVARLEQFTRLARGYRVSLGFEPAEIHIQACQENGSGAIAHVVLTGRKADQERRYKDAVTLRRYDAGWRIVLPKNFGRQSKR
jgi:hypothetical protein